MTDSTATTAALPTPDRRPSSTRLRAAIARRPAGLPRRPRAARQHRLRQLHAGRRRRGRALGRRRSWPSSARASRRRPDPAGRLGDTVVATFDGRAGAPRVLLIGHMDTVFDPGHRGRAPVPHRGRRRLRARRDRHEVRPAGRPVRAQGDHRRARRAAVRAARLHRQPGRGDRLADLDAAHPRDRRRTSTSRSCSSARGRTATSCRRARASSTCGSPSTAGPPTPASSPRRVAARSSRRPGSSRTCTPSTAAGRA